MQQGKLPREEWRMVQEWRKVEITRQEREELWGKRSNNDSNHHGGAIWVRSHGIPDQTDVITNNCVILKTWNKFSRGWGRKISVMRKEEVAWFPFGSSIMPGTKEGNLGNTGDTEGARYDFYIF